jgi:hypothetical protein
LSAASGIAFAVETAKAGRQPVGLQMGSLALQETKAQPLRSDLPGNSQVAAGTFVALIATPAPEAL